MTRRFLALHLPWLAIDRRRRRDPALRDRPLAIWHQAGSRRVLQTVDAPALAPGQTLADAQAICPELVLFEATPREEAAFLEQLALWCLRFTPQVAVDGTEGLLLEATGATALLGGEAGFLAAITANLRNSGLRLCAAMAGSAAATAALARADGMDRIVPPGQELAAIAPLPVTALRLQSEILIGLRRLGLRSIGDVLRQPRAPLARRFGSALIDPLQAVTGPGALPFHSIRPPAAFLAAHDCLEPILTRPAIEHVLDALLGELCQALSAASRGARRLTLRAFRVDRVVQEVVIGTGVASRDPDHLRRLFAERLARLAPELGFERLTLEANATDPLGGIQATLADPGAVEDPSPAPLLAELLDRLGQRMAVRRMALLDSHWPEYAAVPAEPFAPVATPASAEILPLRPVRLLATPIALSATLTVPNGPPVQLRQGRELHRVLRCIGPERLEPEWWGEDAERPARDYYRVQTVEGPRLWVCRLLEPGSEPRWFLHGYLA
ncbi:MAG TPA: DNA polymerase Y family protein [Roseomonas sp.]|nr:DNA polymerase Y family protein [Roseomonas sp.]